MKTMHAAADNMRTDYDVAIVGASLSGSSLAGCLGRAGASVALIDRSHFPRRKACGEGLSNIALAALDRMGFEMGPALASGVPYYGYRMALGGRSFAFASDRGQVLKGVGVQRSVLDQVVLDGAAACPTVSPFLGTSAAVVRRDGRSCSLELSSGGVITARQLVLADGAHSRNANALGIPVRRSDAPLWGMSFILEGTFRQGCDEMLVILKDGFEINCTPVGRHRLNVTFLAARPQVKWLQDALVREQLLAEAMAHLHFSGQPLGDPLQVGPVSAARRTCVDGSTILLGDAAENLDPVAGMGMTHGILMAEIAAGCLLPMFAGDLSPERARACYAKRAAKMSRTYRGFTTLTRTLVRSRARGVVLPVLSATALPGVVRAALGDGSPRDAWPRSIPSYFLSLMGALPDFSTIPLP